jgi:hypothetical protein
LFLLFCTFGKNLPLTQKCKKVPLDSQPLSKFGKKLVLDVQSLIRDISFQEKEEGQRTLCIQIGFVRGRQFADGSGVACPVHDTLQQTWRHLIFFQHECYLHCQVPRIRDTFGKVKQVAVPWARESSGFTMLFEAFAMALIGSEMPVRQAKPWANTPIEYGLFSITGLAFPTQRQTIARCDSSSVQPAVEPALVWRPLRRPASRWTGHN